MLTADQIARIAARAPYVLVLLARNERKRLPRLLAHYRAMGVGSAVVIDNGSSDGTADYLGGEPGVERIAAPGDFQAANFGMDWVNAVRDALPTGMWVVYVDADEYLVYDGWPERRLPAYLADLRPGADTVVGFMLDMYPRGPIAAVSANDDLLAAAPYFDRHYRFRRRPSKPWRRGSPAIEFLGGPRVRLFSSLEREARTGWVSYFVRGQLDRLLRVAPAAWRRPIIERFPAAIPALKKTPITRGHAVRYINSHDVSGATYHDRNCALLHFKFTSEFSAKIDEEIARAQHYRFGSEYILYRKFGLGRGSLDLYCERESARFESARDLVDAGLLKNIDQYLLQVG